MTGGIGQLGTGIIINGRYAINHMACTVMEDIMPVDVMPGETTGGMPGITGVGTRFAPVVGRWRQTCKREEK